MNKEQFTQLKIDLMNNNFEITDITLERGYVSRKKDIEIPYEDHVLHIACGRRNGQLFIYLPCFHSSQYCQRAYLKFN